MQLLENKNYNKWTGKYKLSLREFIECQLAATESENAQLINLVLNAKIIIDDKISYAGQIGKLAHDIDNKKLRRLLDNYLRITGSKIFFCELQYFHTNKLCWNFLLMNKKKYLNKNSMKNFSLYFIDSDLKTLQRLLRHHRLVNKLLRIINRACCKNGVYQLFGKLPVDVLWIIIKYLSN